jgi:hypothetical protein
VVKEFLSLARVVECNEEGRFRFEGLREGDYILHASTRGEPWVTHPGLTLLLHGARQSGCQHESGVLDRAERAPVNDWLRQRHLVRQGRSLKTTARELISWR